ncbi:hypothetical protein HPB49_026181 [Dermacentor silvarum]|nr:hypothetical protein HPB49_026181 [Dermacentor silvarum]
MVSAIRNEQARGNAIAVLQREFPAGSGEYKIYSTCKDWLVAEKVPPTSVTYGYRYPPKPDHLPPLNPVAERLIAPRLPFMSIRRLTHGSGQYSIKGQVVNVPINVPNTVQCLPRNVPDEARPSTFISSAGSYLNRLTRRASSRNATCMSG